MHHTPHPAYGYRLAHGVAHPAPAGYVARPRRAAAGATSRLKQVVFVALFLCFLFGLAYLLVYLFGFDSLSQMHGGDRLVGAIGAGPAPEL